MTTLGERAGRCRTRPRNAQKDARDGYGKRHRENRFVPQESNHGAVQAQADESRNADRQHQHIGEPVVQVQLGTARLEADREPIGPEESSPHRYK